MTDRELLILAAKAAGIDGAWDDDRSGFEIAVPWRNFTNYETWNPLTDDGDALRLGMKLCIWLEFTADKCVGAYADNCALMKEPLMPDGLAAARRAIVRAAAEIGRAMP